MLTYNSDANLAVKGKIKAREIVVIDNPYDWQNWPDYVFKEDYKLKILQEIEIHVVENGKLSDIQ